MDTLMYIPSKEIEELDILPPNKAVPPPRKTQPHLQLITRKACDKELRQRGWIWAIFTKEAEETQNTLPKEVQPFLTEFQDVFPSMPKGLPPIRGIEHQINLIPGALLPNKPAYRCNPEEAK